ncbi:hypothetical protein MKW98_024014 [Papaver atlanticum]|uniref:Uncharacterized protein n=1 Tax=Papaver atlanticum TaxID=357466 RepID=A0AAD4SXR9_9MAGN|nr:hypothetical protein MKW98_024014 [Papaver atlanticum]
MSTRFVTRANKDLKNHDLHTPDPAATADFSMCPPKSKQQIEEGEKDDDCSESSLSEDHQEEYPIASIDSECSDSESEGVDSSGIELKQSTVTATTQSVFYPNKRMKGETNTRSEKSNKDCEAEEPSTFRPKYNLLYEYVPWCTKSSYCEKDAQEKGSWIDSWSSEEPEKDRKGYHYLNINGFYKKETGVGGYGVILRDPLGKPVVASASVQQNGKSYFYHVLDGVKDGLALALEHKKYDLKLLCNSVTLDGCLRRIFKQADDGLGKTMRTRHRQAPYRCGVCDRSLAIPLGGKRLEILFPLLKEIIDTRTKIMSESRYFFVSQAGTVVNQAAYHPAKQLSNKMKTAGKPEIKEIIRPINFGEELKGILFKDACVGPRWYSQHR